MLMTNVENDDVEPVTNLRIPLAPFDKCNLTRLSNSGAGVNAASRVDLTFVAFDPLSELVWSPGNGLSVKCADGSFTECKPSLLWNISGPSNMTLSSPQDITSGRTSCEKHPTDGGNLISSQMALHVEGKDDEGASFVRSPRSISCVKPRFGSSHGYNEGISENMEVQKMENTNLIDRQGLGVNNSQANFTAETTENNAGRGKLSLKTDELKHGTAKTESFSSKQNGKVTTTHPGGRNAEFSSVNEEHAKNEMKKDSFSGEPLPEKLEFSAENHFQFAFGKQILSEASPANCGTRLDQRKRKEKAFLDGDGNERMPNDEENSNETVESCNSAGPNRLFSTRNGREQLTMGNKRAKKQVQVREGFGSMSFNRQDSSFMTWISNMVKGLNKTNHNEALSLALTLSHRNNDSKSKNMGFQTVFQSICCSNTNEQQETKMSKYTKTLSANIVADPETCRTTCSDQNNIVADPETCRTTCSDQNRASFNLASDSFKEANENIDRSPPAEAKLINPLRSFWITRFSPKTPPPPMLNSTSCDQNINVALECSTGCVGKLIPSTCNVIHQKNSEAKEDSSNDVVSFVGKELQKYAPDTEASFDFKRVGGNNAQKSTFKLNPSLSSPELKNSEAMASVFARRLDALKHILPPVVEDGKNRKMATCLYCGRSGHILRDCLQITEIDKENLMREKSLYDGGEESPCFCIRCLQLDHWAISCPMASATTQSHSRVPDARPNCDGEIYGPYIGKHVASSSVHNALKEKLISPLCNLAKRKFSHVPKGVFDAIGKLRLSRMDVIQWMNSHTSSLHLDGFFLRLRLGKWEEGLGGTGYYVACITGEQREKLPQGSKKTISVNIGGIRCLVETQYISNQDFLEDELMAWWCATVKSGGKVPSEDHLKSKLDARERLGF